MSDRRERLREVAEAVFPESARVIAPGSDGPYVLLISWPMGTDPARPFKRSRTVRVMFTEEAMEDYVRGAPGEREAADRRFQALLVQRLSSFDPTHNAPAGTEPPVEKWTFRTVELNG